MDAQNTKKEKSDVIKINLSKIKKIPTHSWAIFSYVLIIALIILLAINFSGNNLGNSISKDKIKPEIQNFVNSQLIDNTAIVQDVKKESGIYVATIVLDGQNVPLYFTTDGKFISQGAPLESIIGSNKIQQKNTGNNNQEKFVDASEDDDAVLGNKNAPVTIIEFSDFQCPFCERFFSESFPQIKSKYIDSGKVKLVYRDFPLNFHPMAQKAAEAAECVRSKGRDEAFWKMHDKIFENQDSLSETNLKKWAKELGYDIDSCLDNGEKTQEVLKDLSDGTSYGVSGTPSFFINGKMIEGAVPYQIFESEIENALASV
ncbi:MAG: thioredoxin domain-containing protein [Candidatus Pacearchaeota archaeon]